MQVNIKLKDASIDKLVKQMTIIVDSREQENKHILSFFDQKKIPYIVRKLEQGDYSAFLSANPELGLPFDISLENVVAIERKGASGSGLSEIAGNFTAGRQAFENEFIRASKNCKNFCLLIENGSWDKIKRHEYRSEMQPKALYNSLLSWRKKYGFHIDFVEAENSGEHICKLLATTLKKLLEE